jgi:hypothetical protein
MVQQCHHGIALWGYRYVEGATTGYVGTQCQYIRVSVRNRRDMKEDHHGLKAVCCNGKPSVMLSGPRDHWKMLLVKECICWLFLCTELCEMASCSWPDSCSCYGPRYEAAAQSFAEKYTVCKAALRPQCKCTSDQEAFCPMPG